MATRRQKDPLPTGVLIKYMRELVTETRFGSPLQTQLALCGDGGVSNGLGLSVLLPNTQDQANRGLLAALNMLGEESNTSDREWNAQIAKRSPEFMQMV